MRDENGAETAAVFPFIVVTTTHPHVCMAGGLPRAHNYGTAIFLSRHIRPPDIWPRRADGCCSAAQRPNQR